jgi:hypothetical protein
VAAAQWVAQLGGKMASKPLVALPVLRLALPQKHFARISFLVRVLLHLSMAFWQCLFGNP